MTRVSEILFIVIMMGCLLVPPLVFKQWGLFAVFMVFGIIFGLIEWISVVKTGKTISQHFWVFSQEHKLKGFIILGGMLVAWLSLLAHLGSKMFKKKE